MTGIVPLPALKNGEKSYYFYSTENMSYDHIVCQELDEYDYDSDCSLGSMNNLYLSLKEDPDHLRLNEKNEKNSVKLNNENNILNETGKISEHNIFLKNQILKKQKVYNKIDTKPGKTLNTTIFYGKTVTLTTVVNFH